MNTIITLNIRSGKLLITSFLTFSLCISLSLPGDVPLKHWQTVIKVLTVLVTRVHAGKMILNGDVRLRFAACDLGLHLLYSDDPLSIAL